MPILASRGALCAKALGLTNSFGFKDIRVIGTPQTGSSTDNSNVTLTFSEAPLPGDTVVVFGGSRNRGGFAPGPVTAGYTSAYNDTSVDPAFDVSYKKMGLTPDTSVVCNGNTGSNLDGVVYACYVLRNVSSDVLDAVATAASGSSTNPNSPSITTVTDKCMVLSLAISAVNDSTITAPSGYSNQVNINVSDTNSYTTGGATFIKTDAGVEDPPAWSNWASGNWRAVSIALRPQRR